MLMRDYQKITDRLKLWLNRLKKSNEFLILDFHKDLEYIFSESGYRKKDISTKRKEILIIHDGGVGDFINLSPSLRMIRQCNPKAHIVLVMYPRGLELAQACPYIDELIANPRLFDWEDLTEMFAWTSSFAENLWKYHFDEAYSFAHYTSNILLGYLSGAKERIGYKENASVTWAGPFPYEAMVPLLNRTVPYEAEEGKTHEVDHYLGLVRKATEGLIQNTDLEIWYTPYEYKYIKKIIYDYFANDIHNLIVMSSGGEAQRKKWPIEYYMQLISHLIHDCQEETFKFILIGGKDDAKELENLNVPGSNPLVLNLAGKLTYRESAAVISLAQYYIGNDTGTMHMAAACDVPVLSPNCFAADKALTKDTIPKVFYPYGVPAVTVMPEQSLDDCITEKRGYGCKHWKEPHCIKQISVAKMLEGFEILREMTRLGIQETIYVK